MEKADVLVIGSGVSGLFFALKAAQQNPHLSIVVMAKSSSNNTNTRYAQGGIAVVRDQESDSFEKHIEDTYNAGGKIGDRKVIEMVVKQAPERLEELLNFNISLDENKEGELDLGLEGGHSAHRIVHYKDITGLEIQTKLLAQIALNPSIPLCENISVVDLIPDVHNPKICRGAYYYSHESGELKTFIAKCVILCTGGCGQVFTYSTNPEIATGDGVAMAYRMGAEIRDMRYIQFHPTALYEADKNPSFLISEAVRGFGAYVVNARGERFLFDHDPAGELATRDLVSNAIGAELKKSGEKTVFLDARHLDQDAFYAHFPTISDYCKSIGLHMAKDLIPIVPVAHYQCGGIQVDMHAKTSIENLYAIGECSHSGLHGKNRLASNSLLEALVYAHQCASYIATQCQADYCEDPLPKLPFHISKKTGNSNRELMRELKSAMTSLYTEHAEINPILKRITDMEKDAVKALDKPFLHWDEIEWRNICQTALIIVKDLAENQVN